MFDSCFRGFPGGSDGKKFACNAGDRIQYLNWEDSPEKGMETHFGILSCLENSMDIGGWQGIVQGVAKSQTWLND